MKKISIFGKMIPAWLVVLLATAIPASAALLTYYGTITATANVQQSILLDSLAWPNSQVTDTISEAAPGGETFCKEHKLTNQMSVAGDVELAMTCSGADAQQNYLDCAGVSHDLSTTITETCDANDYTNDNNMLVLSYVSGKTLSQLLAQPLQYTANILKNPKVYAKAFFPDIVIQITNGINTYYVEAWGNDNSALGPNTVTFDGLMDGTQGYGATIDTNYGVANDISGHAYDASGTAKANLIASAYGAYNVLSVQVRAQAGAACEQQERVTQFIANGKTINLPDQTYLTDDDFHTESKTITSFWNCVDFDQNIWPGTYTITTTIGPETD